MNNKKLVVGIIVAVAIAGLVYFIARKPQVAPVVTPTPSPQNPPVAPQLKPQPSQPPTPSKTAPTPKPIIKPKPSTKAAITNVVLSQAIDANGAPVNPATAFSAGVSTFYAVLSLKNAIQRTELSYTRYYEGKYVDAKVSHPTRDGVRYFHFAFSLKPGQTRKTGHYMLNFYVNGKKAQSISYEVR